LPVEITEKPTTRAHFFALSPISTRRQMASGYHALSLAYFSKTSRLYSACTAFREICPFRSLAIFKRSGSVGARDFRLNLAKNFRAGPGVLPNRLSNNPSPPWFEICSVNHYNCVLGTDSYFPSARARRAAGWLQSASHRWRC
jgi:hypothetical protein